MEIYKIQMNVVDALRMFGPLNHKEAIEKLKMRGIEVSEFEMIEAFIGLVKFGHAKTSDIPGKIKL